MAQAKTPVVSVSLRKAVVELGIQTISALRMNESGYPYVTLITKGSASNNLYFGKGSAEALPAEGSKIVHLLKDATVVETTNEDGEIRFKLSIPKSGSAATGYSSASEMSDLFGLVEVSEFDMSAFKAEFQTKPEEVVKPVAALKKSLKPSGLVAGK